MTAWYRKHLGVELDPGGGASFYWRERGAPAHVGRTVWGPFPADTTYFTPSSASWMINYRVDDLDRVLAELRAEGVQVLDEIEEYEYGRFGWIIDLEGNKIELWEPRGEEGQEG